MCTFVYPTSSLSYLNMQEVTSILNLSSFLSVVFPWTLFPTLYCNFITQALNSFFNFSSLFLVFSFPRTLISTLSISITQEIIRFFNLSSLLLVFLFPHDSHFYVIQFHNAGGNQYLPFSSFLFDSFLPRLYRFQQGEFWNATLSSFQMQKVISIFILISLFFFLLFLFHCA